MLPEQKVAILLAVLGEEKAAETLASLEKPLARKVLGALARLEKVDEKDVETICAEAVALLGQKKNSQITDTEAIKRILAMAGKQLNDPNLTSVLGAASLIQELRDLTAKLDPRTLGELITDEHLPVGAALLCLAPPQNAAKILNLLPRERGVALINAVAKAQPLSLDSLEILKEELEKRTERGCVATSSPGGIEHIAAMLRHLSREEQENLLCRLQEKDEPLAKQLQASLLTVERLTTLSASDLGKILAKMSTPHIALITRNITKTQSDIFLAALSSSRRDEVEEFMKTGEKVKKSELDKAHSQIIFLAETLRNEGKIVFPWEDMLV